MDGTRTDSLRACLASLDCSDDDDVDNGSSHNTSTSSAAVTTTATTPQKESIIKRDVDPRIAATKEFEKWFILDPQKTNDPKFDLCGSPAPTTLLKHSKLGKFYVVRKDELGDKEWERHKEILTFKLHENWQQKKYRTLARRAAPVAQFWREIKNDKEGIVYCAVPPNYGLVHFGLPTTDIRYGMSPLRSEVQFKGTLWGPGEGNCNQQEVVSTVIRRILIRQAGGLVKLATGTGKTDIAMKIICMLGQRAVIVCHSTTAWKQHWPDTIKKRCPGARIAKLTGHKYSEKNLTIAMAADFLLLKMKSCSMQSYPEKLMRLFPIAFIDEVHKAGGNKTQLCIQNLGQHRIVIGASGTIDKRSDGLDKAMFRKFIGEVLYWGANSTEVSKCTRILPILFYAGLNRIYTKPERQLNGVVQDVTVFQPTETALLCDPIRNWTQLCYLRRLIHCGRRVLFFTKREEHGSLIRRFCHLDPNLLCDARMMHHLDHIENTVKINKKRTMYSSEHKDWEGMDIRVNEYVKDLAEMYRQFAESIVFMNPDRHRLSLSSIKTYERVYDQCEAYHQWIVERAADGLAVSLKEAASDSKHSALFTTEFCMDLVTRWMTSEQPCSPHTVVGTDDHGHSIYEHRQMYEDEEAEFMIVHQTGKTSEDERADVIRIPRCLYIATFELSGTGTNAWWVNTLFVGMSGKSEIATNQWSGRTRPRADGSISQVHPPMAFDFVDARIGFFMKHHMERQKTYHEKEMMLLAKTDVIHHVRYGECIVSDAHTKNIVQNGFGTDPGIMNGQSNLESKEIELSKPKKRRRRPSTLKSSAAAAVEDAVIGHGAGDGNGAIESRKRLRICSSSSDP